MRLYKYRGRRLKFNGKSQRLAEWAREVGLSASALRGRIVMGWSLERALTEPVRSRALNRPAQLTHSVLYPDTKQRIANSHAALSEHLHRELRTFLKSFVDALVLQAEAAAMQLAQTHRRGVGGNFRVGAGTGGGSNAQSRVEIEFSQSTDSKPCP